MSGRPTDAPDWATNPNFAAGASEWSGQPNKLKPSAGKIAEGFDPDEDFYVEWLNWIENNHGQWIDYLVSTRGGPQFGDGSDGAATLDGTAAAPVWATKAGSVYTMTQDCYAITILVTGAGVTLITNGYRIYANVSVTCTAGGTINNNGADGTSLLAGAAGHNGFFKGGAAGGASGAPGVAGSAVLGTSCGGSGGAGGNSGSGTPVLAGAGGGNLPQGQAFQHLYNAITFGCAFDGTSTFTPLAGGAGGGGGGDSGADGGCGGAGGGVVSIATPSLILDFATDVMARGGNGGTADSAGLSGGGGGGGGGSMHLACCDITIGSGTLSALTNVPGGIGGGHSPGGGGVNGVNGNAGNLYMFSTNTGAPLAVGSTAHEENGFSAVTAGAGAGHEYVDFTWTQPFAAATGAGGYLVDYQISLTTDGDPIPSCAITNKTPTGFRVRFPAGGFNGEFRWSAK